jgi:hypothetical protein
MEVVSAHSFLLLRRVLGLFSHRYVQAGLLLWVVDFYHVRQRSFNLLLILLSQLDLFRSRFTDLPDIGQTGLGRSLDADCAGVELFG